MADVSNILGSLKGVSRSGDGWQALCPAHNDQQPSLSIGVGADSRVLLNCHRGCKPEDIVHAIGLTLADLFPRNESPPSTNATPQLKDKELSRADKRRAFEFHRYLLENIETLKTEGEIPAFWTEDAIRKTYTGYDPKAKAITFVHTNAKGKAVNLKWHKSASGDQPHSLPGRGGTRIFPLHRLPLCKTDWLLLVEGEPDAISGISKDLPTFCFTNGAGSLVEDLSPLEPYRLIAILPDNDRPGYEGANRWARVIKAAYPSKEILMCRWPEGTQPGFDLTNFFESGKSVNDLAYEIFVGATVFELSAESKIHSATTREGVAAESILTFRTAREIGESTPERPPWVVPGLLARGAITEVDGKIKAAGKTTFLTHLCSAVLDGRTFLDKPTEKAGMVFLTEQSDTTFREALTRAGLLEREDFWILSWPDAVGVSWPDVVKAAVEKCHEVGASVLVVDTLGQWTGIRGSGENDAGEALAAIQPLQIAAGVHNLAVAISRHERKSGGEVGDSGRGSSAFGGAVDIILSLRRAEGNSNPNIRVIHALSRFTETPDTLAIELTNEGYIVLGSEAAVAEAQARAAILDVAPDSEEMAKTQSELFEMAKAGRTTGQKALKGLQEEGLIQRTGGGKKNDPYRYFSSPEIHSATTSTYIVAERKDAVQAT